MNENFILGNKTATEREKNAPEAQVLVAALEGISSILQNQPPKTWLINIRRFLRTQSHVLETHPRVQAFWKTYEEEVVRLLQDRANVSGIEGQNLEEKIALRTQTMLAVIHSKIEYKEPVELPKMRFISWEEIIRKSGGRCTLITRDNKERILEVTASTGKRYEFPIPTQENLAHKGGICRLLLKIIAKAPLDLIDAELPLNDYDVVGAVEDSEVREEAVRLGLTDEGIEPTILPMNYAELAAGRDININQVFLDNHGLTFSDSAYEGVKTGVLKVVDPDRSTYNSMMIRVGKEKIISAWGMFRLVKFLVEGKGYGFEFSPLNRQVDMSDYFLILARKFMKRPDGPEQMEKMFFVAEQLGQTRPDEKNIFDMMRRIMKDLPPLSFQKKVKAYDQVNFARWYAVRSLRSIYRAFQEQAQIFSDLPLVRTESDAKPYVVSLKGFKPAIESKEDFALKWESIVNKK